MRQQQQQKQVTSATGYKATRYMTYSTYITVLSGASLHSVCKQEVHANTINTAVKGPLQRFHRPPLTELPGITSELWDSFLQPEQLPW